MDRLKTLGMTLALFMCLWGGAVMYSGCQDVTVGYLETENAVYDPDSLVIRKVLDDFPGEPNPLYETYLEFGFTPAQIADLGIPARINAGQDYERSMWGMPWVSVAIQGVLGTSPIHMEVSGISTVDGDPEKLRECISVRGNGVIEIPLENEIPVGRYIISLNVYNEGYSKEVKDCFVIIVE